jgi:WD40-like Beta Propeller Repeat
VARVRYFALLVAGLVAILVLAGQLARAASTTRLPIVASRDWWPVWSPNDRDIAFTRINGAGRVFSLQVLDLSTHRAAQVGMSAAQLSPSWSPDSSQLVYASGGILYIVRADGTGKHRYPAPTRAYAPAWRPGTSGQIAYLTTKGAQNTDLWVGNEQWQRSVLGQPSWAPDGSALAFARDDGIYVAARRESQRQVVSAANPGPPVWSPDGTFIAYTANNHVWIVHADGASGPISLAGPFNDIGPLSWSRESDEVAYTVRGALEVTRIAAKATVRPASTVGVGTSYAHRGDALAFSGSHPGCAGHASIRIYQGGPRVPSLTGGCRIAGTPLPDVIDGTPQGGDVIAAGAGNDLVHARNGHRDTIDCGAGRDTATVDRVDVARNCEVVRRG